MRYILSIILLTAVITAQSAEIKGKAEYHMSDTRFIVIEAGTNKEYKVRLAGIEEFGTFQKVYKSSVLASFIGKKDITVSYDKTDEDGYCLD